MGGKRWQSSTRLGTAPMHSLQVKPWGTSGRAQLVTSPAAPLLLSCTKRSTFLPIWDGSVHRHYEPGGARNEI